MLSNKPHTHMTSNSGNRPQYSKKKILNSVNWKIFSVLFAGGLLGILAILPLLLEINSIIAENLDLPISENLQIPALVILGLVQNAILFAIAIIIGLVLAKRLHLTTPILERYFGRDSAKIAKIKPQNILLPACLTGLGTGVLIVTLDKLLFSYYFTETSKTIFSTIPLWKRLLGGFFYAGITEEIIFRLFLFAVLVWMLGWQWQTSSGKPAKKAYWVGNLLSAAIFASLYLPTIAILTPLTFTVVLKTLLVKSMVGIVCGYLYWKQGLESAMAAHATAYIISQIFI